MTSGPVFTIANQLTLLRMLLIPAFVLLVVYGRFGWALVVFIVAGVTDALDGIIARMPGQKSELGAWLDPVADKLLLVTTFIVLTLPNIGLVNRIPDLAHRHRHQPRRRHRPDRGGREPGLGAADVPPVAAGQGGDGLVHPHLRGGDVLQLAGRGVSRWWTSSSGRSLAITIASGVDYVWRIGRSLR